MVAYICQKKIKRERTKRATEPLVRPPRISGRVCTWVRTQRGTHHAAPANQIARCGGKVKLFGTRVEIIFVLYSILKNWFAFVEFSFCFVQFEPMKKLRSNGYYGVEKVTFWTGSGLYWVGPIEIKDDPAEMAFEAGICKVWGGVVDLLFFAGWAGYEVKDKFSTRR